MRHLDIVNINIVSVPNNNCNISFTLCFKPAIHFTDKLDILEHENEKAIKIYGNQPNGLWWLEFQSGLKSERKVKGTLKEASEKNKALRRLKPRFEGSIN
ncbi:hypothetical protein AVEN_169510-1 [Araneus ventricosus]|uniref:Uncharacterized protein n=1 Tax=Araneus ventricosus TaxID=182803 RepID=A0A4Y2MZB8_ARAVE|nr:hypothetical protein AVEN_169510-1 [Araneus ventricosus]